MPDTTSDRWLTRQEAAEYLCSIGAPISAKTLANLACATSTNTGPAYTSSGWRTIRYRRADLDTWAAARKRRKAAGV